VLQQELKKKEMEELDAVFAEFGIVQKDAEEQAESKKKKKTATQTEQAGEGGAAPAAVAEAAPANGKHVEEEEEQEEDGTPLDPAAVRSDHGGSGTRTPCLLASRRMGDAGSSSSG
jgi:hypothetical protein